VPANGDLTQLDIYLDTGWAATHADYRFDWDSALGLAKGCTAANPFGCFLQDYIFSVGTAPQNGRGPACSDDNKYFVVSVGNNSPGDPEGGANPICITASGWYTFRQTFRPDINGNLEVDFAILNTSGGAIASWAKV
jgi:hypothetical protein